MPERNVDAHPDALHQSPIDAGPLEQLTPGAVARAAGGLHDIALVNHRGRVVALTDLCLRCSHSLSKGTLTGNLLVCPHCGWQYDVEQGCVEGLPALRVETHRVRIEDGRILIEPAHGRMVARSP